MVTERVIYTYSHREQSGFSVFQREVLICECLHAVDTRRPRPVSIKEISSLAHEVLDLYQALAMSDKIMQHIESI